MSNWKYGIREVPAGYVVCEVYDHGYYTDSCRAFGETPQELLKDLQRMVMDLSEAIAKAEIQPNNRPTDGFWE